MKKNIETLRKVNIIKRAVEEFSFEFSPADEIEDVYNDAWNEIYEKADIDYISECERNSSYSHIYWQDRNGYVFEEDGIFMASDDKYNRYYRKGDNGNFSPIEWFEHGEDDLVLMDYVIDSDGKVVALVCK